MLCFLYNFFLFLYLLIIITGFLGKRSLSQASTGSSNFHGNILKYFSLFKACFTLVSCLHQDNDFCPRQQNLHVVSSLNSPVKFIKNHTQWQLLDKKRFIPWPRSWLIMNTSSKKNELTKPVLILDAVHKTCLSFFYQERKHGKTLAWLYMFSCISILSWNMHWTVFPSNVPGRPIRNEDQILTMDIVLKTNVTRDLPPFTASQRRRLREQYNITQ